MLDRNFLLDSWIPDTPATWAPSLLTRSGPLTTCRRPACAAESPPAASEMFSSPSHRATAKHRGWSSRNFLALWITVVESRKHLDRFCKNVLLLSPAPLHPGLLLLCRSYAEELLLQPKALLACLRFFLPSLFFGLKIFS